MINENEKLKMISRLIPDETLRHIVFNFDDMEDNEDFLTDERDCLYYLQNLLTLSSIMVLQVFLDWKKRNNSSEEVDFSNSMLRMYNILNRTYDPNKISGDFIDNLIINLVIDHSLNQNEVSSFCQIVGIWKYFSFPQVNNNLSKYIYMLKQRRLSSKYQSSFSFENLCECIEMFSFLRNTEAELINGGTDDLPLYRIVLHMPDKRCIDMRSSLCIAPFFPSFKAYYMYDIDFEDQRKAATFEEKSQILRLNYVCFDNTDTFKVVVKDEADRSFTLLDDQSGYLACSDTAIESFLIDYDIINLDSDDGNSLFFKDYILLNNKYIKELSLTISDSLTRKAKEQIVGHFSKYRAIFDKMSVASFYHGNNSIGRRWDEIVLFLMLEEGIYDFLKFLLNFQEYTVFLTAFYNRFGKDRVKSICAGSKFLRNAEKKAIYIPSKEGRLDYFANAIITLATTLLAPESLNLTKNSYPTDIDDVFEEADVIFQSDKHTDEDKLFCLSNVVIRTVTFLNTFYLGVVRYAGKKKSAILALEDDNSNRIVGYRNYTRAKEEWIDEFKNTVSRSEYESMLRSRSEIPDISVRSKAETVKQLKLVFDVLLGMNESFGRIGTVESVILYEMFGKRSLFNRDDMVSHMNAIIDAVGGNEPSVLYAKIKSFLTYLKTGSNRIQVNSSEYHIENAIYPIVGQYFSSVTSRDGYRYSYFKVDVYRGHRRHSTTIKMITDDVFDFGQSYYCVPNINRVAEMEKPGSASRSSIWISPIIIPCSIFLPDINTEVEVLNASEDFESAVELIYESDAYIYEELFGSLDNAKKVFPELFKTKNCKFYKDNYLIIKEDNEVVGVAAMYKSEQCVWDTDVILKAFGNAGVNPPESFGNAVEHMQDVFNDALGNSFYMLDDICVRSTHRNRGIGRSLINYIIKEAERDGASLILSTYADNSHAYNIYTYLGFIPYSKNTSNISGGKDYFRMIKI